MENENKFEKVRPEDGVHPGKDINANRTEEPLNVHALLLLSVALNILFAICAIIDH